MSERFPAEWLALREPVDHRSRARELDEALVRWWQASASDDEASGAPTQIEIVDLAAGAGSNLRYLSGRLPFMQSWTLIDHDDDLLSGAVTGVDARHRVARVHRSLAVAGPDAVSDVIRPASGGRADVVTASALFDLVSADWMHDLAVAVARSSAGALFTLSYDGSISWSDHDPDDDLVRNAVNDHQRGDKGFGPALGPEAGATIVTCFEQEGYRVRTASSPWQLNPDDADLLYQLIEGWANAAIEQRPDERERITAWRRRRHESVGRVTARCEVGHLDVLLLPPS